MDRVLLEIPANAANQVLRVFSVDRDVANEHVKEGRKHAESTYAGARIVPKDEWAKYRFIGDEQGRPVQNADQESLPRALRREREESDTLLSDVDEQTQGDVRSELAELKAMFLEERRSNKRLEDEIRADERAKIKEELALENAGKKSKPARTKSKKDE